MRRCRPSRRWKTKIGAWKQQENTAVLTLKLGILRFPSTLSIAEDRRQF
jgi:hypothetical protein